MVAPTAPPPPPHPSLNPPSNAPPPPPPRGAFSPLLLGGGGGVAYKSEETAPPWCRPMVCRTTEVATGRPEFAFVLFIKNAPVRCAVHVLYSGRCCVHCTVHKNTPMHQAPRPPPLDRQKQPPPPPPPSHCPPPPAQRNEQSWPLWGFLAQTSPNVVRFVRCLEPQECWRMGRQDWVPPLVQAPGVWGVQSGEPPQRDSNSCQGGP